MADVSARMGIDYSFSPNPEILAAEMDSMGVDVRSFREPLTRAVREVVIPSMQENFNVGGRPEWEPISDATSLIKGKVTASQGTLVRTGTLQKNMAFLSLWSINTTSAAITELPSRIAYGGIHQAGSSSGSGRGSNIPARPFAVIQDEDEDKISDVFDRWLGERAAEAGW